MRWAALLLALALSACAHQPGWTNSGAIPFENASARCQIETQVVEGPAWETCMEALSWRRRTGRKG